MAWLYKSDPALKLPYQDNLSALIHEPTFKAAVGQKIFIKAKLVKDLVCVPYRTFSSDHACCQCRPRSRSGLFVTDSFI